MSKARLAVSSGLRRVVAWSTALASTCLVTLFGSWLRAFVTVYILIHSLVVLALVFLIWIVEPRTLFRIDALTDFFEIVVSPESGGLAWGSTRVTPVGPPIPHCESAEIALPPGTIITGDRNRSGQHSLTIKFPNLAEVKNPEVLTCADGQHRKPPPILSIVPDTKAGRDAVFSINGALQVGRDIQSETDPIDVDILRSGRVVAEALSYPFGSRRVSAEHNLLPGDRLIILSGDQTSTNGKTVSAESFGIVLLRHDEMRIIASAIGQSAEISRPGYSSFRPLAFSPSPWERFQAQAEYGFVALLLIVVLNIAGALT
jgi:hypothetical protein